MNLTWANWRHGLSERDAILISVSRKADAAGLILTNFLPSLPANSYGGSHRVSCANLIRNEGHHHRAFQSALMRFSRFVPPRLSASPRTIQSKRATYSYTVKCPGTFGRNFIRTSAPATATPALATRRSRGAGARRI